MTFSLDVRKCKRRMRGTCKDPICIMLRNNNTPWHKGGELRRLISVEDAYHARKAYPDWSPSATVVLSYRRGRFAGVTAKADRWAERNLERVFERLHTYTHFAYRVPKRGRYPKAPLGPSQDAR